MESYDYIVVGAGSAGAVLAARLSEDPILTVLLIEAGNEETAYPDLKTPLAAESAQMTSADWKYHTVPQKNSSFASKKGDNRQYWPRGKVLGGCSTINFMQYVRGSKFDYDEWANNGCTGWSYNDVLPYFIKSEDMLDGTLKHSRHHGTGGALGVNKVTDPLARVFKAAGKELEYDTLDYNGKSQKGLNRSQVNVRNGERASTAREFLRPAMSRPNLRVEVNAHVSKIILNGNEATGVAYIKDGTKYVISATREVILSAGAIGSPQLLMLSGIGPKHHLKEIGIPVVADLPVGDNLQDHMYSIVPSAITAQDGIIATGAQDLAQYVMSKTGHRTSPIISGTAFLQSEHNKKPSHTDTYPAIQIQFASRILDVNNIYDKDKIKGVIPDGTQKGITLMPTILHPKSRGTVRLTSNDPFDHPLIDPNYLSEDEDINVFVEAMKETDRLFQTKAFKQIGASIEHLRNIAICKGLPFKSDEYYKSYVRNMGVTANNPTSTCKMGKLEDPSTVVDPELRVKGVKNLRIVDASIMPSIVSGNTNAPTIMIAEKAADMIIGKNTVGKIKKRLNSKL